MPSIAQPESRALATVFGVLMVATSAFGSDGPAAAVGFSALAAVGVGIVFREAATLAVLLSLLTIALSGPPSVLAALSGLAAVAYLVCGHAASGFGALLVSWPTIVAAVGFTCVGLVATSFPLQLPWLPLAAPLAVLPIYVLATRPFVG